MNDNVTDHNPGQLIWTSTRTH